MPNLNANQQEESIRTLTEDYFETMRIAQGFADGDVPSVPELTQTTAIEAANATRAQLIALLNAYGAPAGL